MIRDLLIGIVAGFFLGLFIASQCIKAPAPAAISKIDTLVISVARHDTIVAIHKGQQSVIVKDCKYAEIKQDLEQQSRISHNDSMSITQSSTPITTPSTFGRFGFGVGIYSQWSTYKPAIGYSVFYTIREPLRIEATVVPSYRLLGIKAVATF